MGHMLPRGQWAIIREFDFKTRENKFGVHFGNYPGLTYSIKLTNSNYKIRWASLVAQMVKNLPAKQESQLRSLGQEDPLEKGMSIHSSILAWRTPFTEEPGGPQSMGLQKLDMTEQLTHTHTHTHWNKQSDTALSSLASLCVVVV